MRDETAIDEREAEERHEAMDYAQHEGTWENITGLIKWAVIQLAFIVVGLYCCLIAGNPVLGVLLILIGLVGPLVARFLWPRPMA